MFTKDIQAIAEITVVPTILEVLCATTGMGLAAIARVTQGRWVACSVLDNISFGLSAGNEMDVTTTICSEVRDSLEPVIISDATTDGVYACHAAPGAYNFKSYIAVPIILTDGGFFGTLCAIDRNPVDLNKPEILGMFKLFAKLIAFHLDAHARLDASAASLNKSQGDLNTSAKNLSDSEISLSDERAASDLREQFIAVLGHDLRNPLASIESGVRLLRRIGMDDKSKMIMTQMSKSVARMTELVNNVVDFARAKLGGGISIAADSDVNLQDMLTQVIAELQSAWPERKIESDFAIAQDVDCDPNRVAQLLSNLVGNAVTHGSGDSPIRIRAATEGSVFNLSVTNGGAAIAPETLRSLFKPFFRSTARPGNQGLGLGLYIASKIASAHHGTIQVASSADETRFLFSMPLKQETPGLERLADLATTRP